MSAVNGTGTRKERRMWAFEDWTRIRCRERIEEADRHRRARRFTAGRAWQRLAVFATLRADRARRRVEA